MHLVLMGPPGAGKGTQAALIARDFDIPHISIGDMLRDAVKQRTKLGEKAKEYMDRGDLVPDVLVVDITGERLAAPDTKKGFVLDGFPRTLEQAVSLKEILADVSINLDVVLNLEVSEEELLRRLTGRRVCPNCQATYHLVFNPPKSLGVCDRCGHDLIQRDDDKKSTVKQRLQVYYSQSRPLVDYYRERGLLVNVDGDQSVDEVYEDVKEIIG